MRRILGLALGAALASSCAHGKARRFEAALASSPADDHDVIRERLEKALTRLRKPVSTSDDDIRNVSVEDLLNIIDDELLDLS